MHICLSNDLNCKYDNPQDFELRDKVGLGLFFGSFIVSRIDKQEMKADMRAADLRMDMFRNETKVDMDRMRIETRLYNIFTLLVALSAIVVPFLINKSS